MKIKTNNVPRHILYGCELPVSQRKEFDWLSDEEFNEAKFVKYKGIYYALSEFMRCDNAAPPLSNWQGYYSDSYFSGILIKFKGSDSVIVGQYFSQTLITKPAKISKYSRL